MPAASNCPDVHQYRILISGQLSAAEVEILLAHLEGCAACARDVATFAEQDSLAELVRESGKLGEGISDESVALLIQHLRKRYPGKLGDPLLQSQGSASPELQGVAPLEQLEDKDRASMDFLIPAQAPDELGRLGPYRVLKILGSGGMGVVYEAEDPQLKRLVALKVMLPGLGSSPAARKRFMREAQSAAAVKHDHIVGIYQVGEDRGAPYLAMEFLQGEPLSQRLQREGKLPLTEVLRIGREIAEGLEAAHECGLIHRDIKPANVWLEEERGRVKILDFGLARAMREEAHLTQSGAIVGTPAYMAPEQAQSKPVDRRCDLFSLGVVFYRLCTGEMPFRGGDTLSTLMAVATESPRPPREFDGVPEALSELVMQLLEKDPSARPVSAGDVAHRLQALERMLAVPAGAAWTEAMQPTSPAHAPWSRPPARRRVLSLAIAASALAAVLAVTVLLLPTKDGVLRIEINDPAIQVTVGAGGYTIRGASKEDLRVEPGEKTVKIKRGELEFETDKFVLKKGATVTLKIEYLDGKVQVAKDDKPFAEREASPAGKGKAQNLLMNGSFEEGPETENDGVHNIDLHKGSTDLKGWEVRRGGPGIIDASYWKPADGQRSLTLSKRGSISQHFKTKKGQKYCVTFRLAGDPLGEPAEKKLQIRAAGKSADFVFDTTGKDKGNMGWVSKSWEFTADSDQTTLELAGLTESIFGVAIDDVVVAVSE